jgi:hypothetical protein
MGGTVPAVKHNAHHLADPLAVRHHGFASTRLLEISGFTAVAIMAGLRLISTWNRISGVELEKRTQLSGELTLNLGHFS